MDAVGYAIDIAAQMTGGAQTFAELDRITAKLSQSGKGAEHFRDAISKVSGELDSVREAAQVANDALDAGSAEYRVLERAALQAAKATENAALAAAKAGAAYDAAFKDNLAAEELEPLARALVKAQQELASFTAISKASDLAVEGQATALKGLEAAATAVNAKEQQLVKTLGNVRTMSQHVDTSLTLQDRRLNKVANSLGMMGGPVGTLGQKMIGLTQGFDNASATLGASNAVALVAVAGVALLAAAVVALTAAMVAGVLAIARWAVGLGDSARNARLASEAMEAIHPELVALRGDFAALSQATGMHTDELQELVGKLREAKVSLADMPAALRAAALAQTALGEGGLGDFIADLKSGKLTVANFAAETERSLGGIVARQLLGLEAQTTRFQKNMAGVFGGMNVEPALLGLSTLVGLFDKATGNGQAMKFLFESIFQPLINQAENAAYIVEAFYIGFQIGLLKLYMLAKPAIQAITEFFGFEDMRLVDLLGLAKGAGELLAPVLAGAVLVFGALAAAVGLVVLGFNIFTIAIAAAVAGVVWLATSLAAGVAGIIALVVGLPSTITDKLLNFGWGEVGANMIRGIANGITSSVGLVINAMGGAAQAAITAAKKALGIASPSKVFAGLGEFTGEGFAQGVESMQGPAQAAMGALVEPPESPLSQQDALSGNIGPAVATSAAPASGGAGAATPGTVIDLRGAMLDFSGSKDAPKSVEAFGEWLTRALEGDAIALTGAEPA